MLCLAQSYHMARERFLLTVLPLHTCRPLQASACRATTWHMSASSWLSFPYTPAARSRNLCTGKVLLKVATETSANSHAHLPPAAGSQHGESCPWQGHVERPDRQGESGLKGSSAWASSPRPKSVCLLSAIPYSSDITGGYPQPPFSGKSWFRAPVNSLLHIKRMSQLKPLW